MVDAVNDVDGGFHPVYAVSSPGPNALGVVGREGGGEVEGAAIQERLGVEAGCC